MRSLFIGLVLFPPRLAYELLKVGVKHRVRRAVYG